MRNGQRRLKGGTERSLSGERRGEGKPPPRPPHLKGRPTSPLFREGEGPRGSGRRYPGRATETGRESPSRESRHRLLSDEVRGADRNVGRQSLGACAVLLHITTRSAGCGRLQAAFDPTGHEQGEEQN